MQQMFALNTNETGNKTPQVNKGTLPAGGSKGNGTPPAVAKKDPHWSQQSTSLWGGNTEGAKSEVTQQEVKKEVRNETVKAQTLDAVNDKKNMCLFDSQALTSNAGDTGYRSLGQLYAEAFRNSHPIESLKENWNALESLGKGLWEAGHHPIQSLKNYGKEVIEFNRKLAEMPPEEFTRFLNQRAPLIAMSMFGGPLKLPSILADVAKVEATNVFHTVTNAEAARGLLKGVGQPPIFSTTHK